MYILLSNALGLFVVRGDRFANIGYMLDGLPRYHWRCPACWELWRYDGQSFVHCPGCFR